MIIENLEQVTQAVLDEMKRTPDVRTKEILASLVRHLHAFVREVGLTEKEFDRAINYVAALGQLTTESHNEVRLMAGSLGVSTLVCLMNNGPDAATESSANRQISWVRFGERIPQERRTADHSSGLQLPGRLSSLRVGCAIRRAGRLPEPRSMSGTHLPSDSMRVKTPSRRR